jgi:hypothetical protein
MFQNTDISSHGSIKRRYGRFKMTSLLATYAQGIFIYRVRVGGVLTPYIITALDGKLYFISLNGVTMTQIVVMDGGSPVTFQATRSIEAAQYGDTLYVATGSFLVEVKFDGTTWTGVKSVPYQPTVMEALYIGTNALAPSPNSYIQDGNPGILNVIGVQITDPTTSNTIISGAVNKPMNLTAFISKASSGDVIEYQWEAKRSSETTWSGTPLQAFDSTKKTWSYNPDTATKYDFRLTIRKQGTTTPTAVMTVTSFEVKDVPDPTNKPMIVSGIQTCNRIMLHYDRLLIAGDTTAAGQIYISDLNNPRYYPTNNTVNFDTGKQEDITAIIRFQNNLIFFTTTSIQTLIGKSPDDFERYLINDGVGCAFGKTVKVVGNRVYFLSAEGLQALKPNPYRLETLNVERIDLPVKSELANSNRTDASAIVNNNQYWLYLPSAKVTYRLYYETGAWVKDTSTKLDIMQATSYNDIVYEITKTGNLYRHDKNLFSDDGDIYTMTAETKLLDLSASFNFKKLKKLHILAKHFSTHNVQLYVKVQADSAIILTPDSGDVQNIDGYAVWVPTHAANFTYLSGALMGQWVLGTDSSGASLLGDVQLSSQKAPIRGKCRRVKISFSHEQDKPCEIYGFGLEFKLKKP